MDAVVVILGQSYGDKQDSGLSATHEEFREARERVHTLVFVQSGETLDQDQKDLIREARAWASGRITATFDTADDLRDVVTTGLIDLERRLLSNIDVDELLERARNALTGAVTDWDSRGKMIAVALAGGPRQQILRPSQLESKELAEWLQQEAQFGKTRLLQLAGSTGAKVREHTLTLMQSSALVSLDEIGTVLAGACIRHVPCADRFRESRRSPRVRYENFEDTATGRFILAARAFIAEVEREKIAERTTRGKAERARSGRIPQGKGQGCYGCVYDRVRGRSRLTQQRARWCRASNREPSASAFSGTSPKIRYQTKRLATKMTHGRPSE